MKFYVSTALANKDQQREVARALQGLGPAWRQTYDWTLAEGVEGEGRARLAAEEVDGMVEADLLVVLLPGGRGTHAELGVALGLNAHPHTVSRDQGAPAMGPRIVVWSWDGSHFEDGEVEACLFYFAPGVERVTGPLSDLVAYLA